MTEIAMMWFLSIMIGNVPFAGLYWYDTKEACEIASKQVVEFVQDTKCVPLPILGKAK